MIIIWMCKQYGDRVYKTAEEAEEETINMLNVYANMLEEYFTIPVLKGQETEKEKFAGAKATYTIESLMHDGKALQSGASHDFGDGFAREFNIKVVSRMSKI